MACSFYESAANDQAASVTLGAPDTPRPAPALSPSGPPSINTKNPRLAGLLPPLTPVPSCSWDESSSISSGLSDASDNLSSEEFNASSSLNSLPTTPTASRRNSTIVVRACGHPAGVPRGGAAGAGLGQACRSRLPEGTGPQMPCPSPFERTPEQSPKRLAALVPLGSNHANWERFQLEEKEIRGVWGVFSQAPWVSPA